ncbi:ABC transporter G family member 5 [Linum perenne]
MSDGVPRPLMLVLDRGPRFFILVPTHEVVPKIRAKPKIHAEPEIHVEAEPEAETEPETVPIHAKAEPKTEAEPEIVPIYAEMEIVTIPETKAVLETKAITENEAVMKTEIKSILFSIPVYWLSNLNDNFKSLSFFLLLIWRILYTANSITCFSTLVPNFIVRNSVILGVMGSFFLFSDYFVSRHGIPNYWKFMHYISPFKFMGYLILRVRCSSTSAVVGSTRRRRGIGSGKNMICARTGVFPAEFSQSAIASPSTLCTTLPLLSQSVTFGTNQPTHEMMRSMASSERDSSSSNYMGRSKPAPIEKKDTELAPIQIPLI